MPSLHGPFSISSQMQVKLPSKVARELRLQRGDSFYWRSSDSDQAVLLLIPAEVVERRYVAGERQEVAADVDRGAGTESEPTPEG